MTACLFIVDATSDLNHVAADPDLRIEPDGDISEHQMQHAMHANNETMPTPLQCKLVNQVFGAVIRSVSSSPFVLLRASVSITITPLIAKLK
jgi:hypothetical protein